MKKINSIWFGGKIIGLGLVFCLVIPLILFGISKLWTNSILMPLSTVSIAIGLIIFTFLVVILFIELKQDKKLNIYYHSNRYCKMKLSDSIYECQNCGNRNLKADDRCCTICGIKFV